MNGGRRPKILVVDDEVGIRELLTEILADEGYAVVAAESADAAWDIRLREKLSLILLDIWMPGKDGITLLKQWNDAGVGGVPIIVMSGHATIDTAVEAMKLGALEVLEKPVATSRLLASLQKNIRRGGAEIGSPEIQSMQFGKSPAMAEFKKQLLKASDDSRPALITGTPAAGAAFYAQLLLAPPQTKTMYVRRDMLSGPTAPLLREIKSALAIVRMADQLTPTQQNGLLALAQESPRADARLVVECAPPEKIGDDFYRRLEEALPHHIAQPPLSQYADDIPFAADFIARRLARAGGTAGRRLSPAAVNLLMGRTYENDFMELLALVRSALILSETENAGEPAMRAAMDKLALDLRSPVKGRGNIFNTTLRKSRTLFEREYFIHLREVAGGNIQKAMDISGLERTYLYRKLKQYRD